MARDADRVYLVRFVFSQQSPLRSGAKSTIPPLPAVLAPIAGYECSGCIVWRKLFLIVTSESSTSGNNLFNTKHLT